jgi:rhamnogalacturonyl hydrolase YesR
MSESCSTERIAKVGRRVAINVVESQERNMQVTYSHICSYYGALCFAEATGDIGLRDRIEAAYGPCLSGELKPMTDHVDNNVFGMLPFELFRQTGKYEYLSTARYLADEEFEHPREDGLTRYTRFWVDDMYMVGSLQAQAHKSLRDPLYADRGVDHLLAYLEKLQRPDGLIQPYPETPIIWGRGCGWAAAGITEMLRTLPNYNPKRALLLNAYRKLADALVKYQGESGMWHQVVDLPDAWPETSGTGMFIFALATGVKERWVQSSPYRDAAEHGWRALGNYIDASGRVRETAGGISPVGATVTDYLNACHLTNDFHGHAAVLWAATSLIDLSN